MVQSRRIEVKIYTVEEAATELGVSVTTIKTYVRLQQLIPLRKVGRNWIFTQEAIDACKAIPRHPGGPRKRPRDTDDGKHADK
jgi:hypothetical protein